MDNSDITVSLPSAVSRFHTAFTDLQVRFYGNDFEATDSRFFMAKLGEFLNVSAVGNNNAINTVEHIESTVSRINSDTKSLSAAFNNFNSSTVRLRHVAAISLPLGLRAPNCDNNTMSQEHGTKHQPTTRIQSSPIIDQIAWLNQHKLLFHPMGVEPIYETHVSIPSARSFILHFRTQILFIRQSIEKDINYSIIFSNQLNHEVTFLDHRTIWKTTFKLFGVSYKSRIGQQRIEILESMQPTFDKAIKLLDDSTEGLRAARLSCLKLQEALGMENRLLWAVGRVGMWVEAQIESMEIANKRLEEVIAAFREKRKDFQEKITEGTEEVGIVADQNTADSEVIDVWE
ncbi:MAG: hypothetical protein Q9164_005057, partial [Protoblastenia rupestris]